MSGPAEIDDVRWGLGDAALGFLLAYVLTLVFSPLVYKLTGQSLDTPSDKLPLSTLALQQVPFYGGMLAVPLIATFYKGRGPVADFGLRMRWFDAPVGFVTGIFTQYAALLLYIPVLWWTSVSSDDISKPARQLSDKAHGTSGVVLLVLVVAIAAPIVEEIFFRGLLLRSLERRMSRKWAIVASSALFAAAHFEPLQFPALFVFGLVAATLATRTGRLGPGMWAHFAFNLLAVVSLLQ